MATASRRTADRRGRDPASPAAQRARSLRVPRLLALLLLGLATATATLMLRQVGALVPLARAEADLGAAARRHALGPPAPDVLVVAVGEADIRRHGWPLSDALFAELLERLAAQQPVAIGVDIYRDTPVAPGTEALTAVLAAHPEIIWVTKFGENGVEPPAPLRDTDRRGFADLIVDADGVVRRAPLFLDDGEIFDTSFALVLAARLLAQHGVALEASAQNPEYLAIGPTTLPPLRAGEGPFHGVDDRGYQLALDYARGPVPAQAVPLATVLDGALDPALVRGRLVLVGTRAETVRDDFIAPLSDGATTLTKGVDLHAAVIDQLLRHGLDGQPPLRDLGIPANTAWIVAAALAGAVIGGLARGPLAVAGGLVLLLGAQVAMAWVGALAWLWTPAAPGALAGSGALALGALYAGWRERADRAALMGMFSRHVAGPVAERLWRERHSYSDGAVPRPQTMTVTVLFADIADFTPTAERLDDAALMAWLNARLTAMAEAAMAEGGYVDKFVGDAAMVVFGAPNPRGTEAEVTADARAAARAALGIRTRIAALDRTDTGLPPTRVRIGIHTGPVTAGVIGAGARLEYTIIGDTVNVAARLERVAVPEPGHGCGIAVSEATGTRLGADFRTRPLGQVALKGKSAPMSAFALVGIVEEDTAWLHAEP